jgi:hypothetical protein
MAGPAIHALLFLELVVVETVPLEEEDEEGFVVVVC